MKSTTCTTQFVSKSGKAMNRFKSSAKSSCERERELRHNEFHTVPLGVAGCVLRQRVQVIKSTDEWLRSMLDADVEKLRLQLGEPVVGRLAEQLDRLAGALRLYEDATTMEPSSVPLRTISTAVREKGLDLHIRLTRAVVMSKAVLVDGIVQNLVHSAVRICRWLCKLSRNPM